MSIKKFVQYLRVQFFLTYYEKSIYEFVYIYIYIYICNNNNNNKLYSVKKRFI